MKVVLSGEIEGYQRVDAEAVDVKDLRVKRNAVLHLASPQVFVHVLPGCGLHVEPQGVVMGGLSAWNPRVIVARTKAWIRRRLAV